MNFFWEWLQANESWWNKGGGLMYSHCFLEIESYSFGLNRYWILLLSWKLGGNVDKFWFKKKQKNFCIYSNLKTQFVILYKYFRYLAFEYKIYWFIWLNSLLNILGNAFHLMIRCLIKLEVLMFKMLPVSKVNCRNQLGKQCLKILENDLWQIVLLKNSFKFNTK